jgi:adenylate cyclase
MRTYMRLDPYHPTSAIGWLGVTHFALGDLAEAQRLLNEAVARSPGRLMFHYWLAAALGQLGDLDAAHTQASTVLRLQPSFTIDGSARPLAVFRHDNIAQCFFEGLRISGLPQ